MNFLTKNFIAQHQAKLLFIVVWAHVTILDLCYVTYSGPIFFWQKNAELFTVFIHLSVAILTLVFYFCLSKIFALFRENKLAKTHHSIAKSTKYSVH